MRELLVCVLGAQRPETQALLCLRAEEDGCPSSWDGDIIPLPSILPYLDDDFLPVLGSVCLNTDLFQKCPHKMKLEMVFYQLSGHPLAQSS